MTIYQRAKDLGCQVSGYYSDLHVLLDSAGTQLTKEFKPTSYFRDSDGNRYADYFGQFSPYWDAKGCRTNVCESITRELL
jgi:hypothetical protein